MDSWTKIMNMHQDFFSSLFVHVFFISCVWIIAFFILNLTIATMLMKYEQVEEDLKNRSHAKVEGGGKCGANNGYDIFEKELHEMGQQIF